MNEGFQICVNFKSRKEVPELSQAAILDKVSSTVVEMAVENGKMARTLHEVLIRVLEKETLSKKDVMFLRNVIIGNLGRQYADPFTKEEH